MLKRTRISIAIGAAFGAGALGVLPAAQAQDTQKLDRVEITGSSIKRIEAETALPVQVLTRDDIQKTGAANVEQLMQTISANSSSGQLVAASSSGATTLGLSGVSLRGLNSQRTLVLVNGRRVAPYGYGFTNDSVSVDVNAIPIAAIDRVEVLKDGASAVYGSDAIAGVVNFILRRDFQGLEVSAEYGAARQDSGAIGRGSVAWGFGSLAKDKFNVLATLSFSKEQALFGRERKFANSGINIENLNDTTSGNTHPANFLAVDGSAGGNPSYPNCPGPYAQVDPIFELFGITDVCRFDPSPLVTLTPKAERVGIFTSGRFDVTPTLQLFGEFSFAKNEQTVRIQPTPISDQFTIPLNNPLANLFPYNGFVGGEPAPGGVSPIPYSTILLTSANPFYPTAYVTAQTGGATPDLLVRWRAGALGDRDTTDTSEATRLVFGARGSFGKWEYEGAALYSLSEVTQTINDGYAYYSRILPILNNPAIGVNFFGPQTATAQAAINSSEFFGDALKTKSSLASLGGKVSSDLAQMANGPLAFAAGAELRQENYELDPSQALIQGDLTGYGGNFAAVDKSRVVTGLFGEVNVPLLRGLEVNGALRYDHYEGVGSSTTPKVGIRYQPVRQVLLRGSAGKGYRAPSLLDLHAPRTTGVSAPGLSDPDRCPTTNSSLDCFTQFPVTNGGNSALKPEKSTNFTAGIVLEPVNNLTVAIDYFNIALKDTITTNVPAATILSDLGRYGSLIRRGAVQPGFPSLPGPIIDIDQTNINLGETKLAGWDLDIRTASGATAYGRWSFSLNGTYLSKYDQQNPDGSFTNVLDTANNNTGGTIVRWRHYAAVGWQAGPVGLTFAQSFQKKYLDLPATFSGETRTVGSYELYHLHGQYTGFRNLTLQLGVKNLFDKDPPYTNAGGQTSFQAGYDPTYVDPRGRFVYGRVTYKFL